MLVTPEFEINSHNKNKVAITIPQSIPTAVKKPPTANLKLSLDKVIIAVSKLKNALGTIAVCNNDRMPDTTVSEFRSLSGKNHHQVKAEIQLIKHKYCVTLYRFNCLPLWKTLMQEQSYCIDKQ